MCPKSKSMSISQGSSRKGLSLVVGLSQIILFFFFLLHTRKEVFDIYQQEAKPNPRSFRFSTQQTAVLNDPRACHIIGD